MDAAPEGLMTVRATARRLGRSEEQVRRYLREGRIEGKRMGGQWFIVESSVKVPERQGPSIPAASAQRSSSGERSHDNGMQPIASKLAHDSPLSQIANEVAQEEARDITPILAAIRDRRAGIHRHSGHLLDLDHILGQVR